MSTPVLQWKLNHAPLKARGRRKIPARVACEYIALPRVRNQRCSSRKKHSDLHWTIPTGIEILAHVTVYSVV
eukprot:1379131-Amorphochlora_amoeboformis.AAC.2